MRYNMYTLSSSSSSSKKKKLLCHLPLLLVLLKVASFTGAIAIDNPSPTILDTDYGSFVDDIFAVGLLVQSTDVLDPKLIITTSEEPDLSAKCVSEQVRRSELDFDIPIAIGETLPPYSERGTVCGVPGLIGFALEETCRGVNVDMDVDMDVDVDVVEEEQPPLLIENGVDYMANMLRESNRTDWTYIVIGGQTSLQQLIARANDDDNDDDETIMAKIKTLVIMGGNWCTGFDAYPDVPTPTAETNIGCDMKAANSVLESAARYKHNNKAFPTIYYVPIATVNVLTGDDYSLITDAAASMTTTTTTTTTTTIQGVVNSDTRNNSNLNPNPIHNKVASATVDFYKAWSTAARSNPDLLVYKEAMKYDPATESTPQFDAVAVLVAMDIVRGTAGARVAQHEFANGVHFVTNEEAATAGRGGGGALSSDSDSTNTDSGFFLGKRPEAAYSLWTGNEKMMENSNSSGGSGGGDGNPISGRCKDLTPHHFDPKKLVSSRKYKYKYEEQEQASSPSPPVAIQAALGFISMETEQDFFHEMALRISGLMNSKLSSPPPVVIDAAAIVSTITTATTTITTTTGVDLDSTNIENNVSSSSTSLPSASAKVLDLPHFLDSRYIMTDDYSLVA